MVDLINSVHQSILAAALTRWARSPERDKMLLRGSLVTAAWVGPERRHAEDLDLLALFPFDRSRVIETLRTALQQPVGDAVSFTVAELTAEDIFAETEFPGLRLQVPATVEEASGSLQIDVGFGDPVPWGPVQTEISIANSSVELPTPCAEVAFGWKLHGLVEKEGHEWRPKDLADLWLMGLSLNLDSVRLREAIRVAFESRDGPVWRLDRLARSEMGMSATSRRIWRRFRERHPETGVPSDLREVVCFVADLIAPHWEALRSPPELFAQNPSRAQIRATIRDDTAFQELPWDGEGSTIVYHRISRSTFPRPQYAATAREFRDRLLRRECRGITFDSEGALLARPWPAFEQLPTSGLHHLQGGVAVEKLDGSLVFPTPVSNGWVLRTRRRQSEISEQATRFAVGSERDFHGLIEFCLQQKWTPLFEWCSRQRPIVLDHPQDRLILTGIRKNDSGEFVSREQQEELCAGFQVEIAAIIGRIEDPLQWQADIASWTDREGVVIYANDGRLYKLKADRYRILHRTVEGPHRNRARWQLILEGALDALLTTSALRGIDLQTFVTDVESSLDQAEARILDRVNALPDRSPDSRRQLAGQLTRACSFMKHLHFTAFDEPDFSTAFRRIMLNQCHSEPSFRSAVRLIQGPLPENP